MIQEAIARARGTLAASLTAVIGGIALASSPVHAQGLETFDPDEAYAAEQDTSGGSGAIDADLSQPGVAPPADGPQRVPADTAGPATVETSPPGSGNEEFTIYGEAQAETAPVQDAEGAASGETVAGAEGSTTYGEDDLIGAAEGVFGKGAEGLARMIEDLLKDQGEPNGYIVGREAGGAFVFGARYGSGTLFHKVEGQRKVYWTGPSVGFDAGANAANTFVLVYNLFDTEELFERYPAGEGQAYLVGGLHASYMRKGDVVLIPIRMGAGVRLGVNAGYMKFSKKQRWLPF